MAWGEADGFEGKNRQKGDYKGDRITRTRGGAEEPQILGRIWYGSMEKGGKILRTKGCEEFFGKVRRGEKKKQVVKREGFGKQGWRGKGRTQGGKKRGVKKFIKSSVLSGMRFGKRGVGMG